MAAVKKRYKLRLNSLDKIEELLQELYNEADKNIVEIPQLILEKFTLWCYNIYCRDYYKYF